jgi:hypothetical protein
MKTLFLFRHTLNLAGLVTREGFALAEAVGQSIDLRVPPTDVGPDVMWIQPRIARIFHGMLLRTAQTAIAFCKGLGYVPTLMPAVSGLGDDAMFKEMANDAFRAAQKTMSNLQALQASHPAKRYVEWAKEARVAVDSMFEQMSDDEIAVGIFHSPTIELAASTLQNDLVPNPDGWDSLKEMDALVFVQSTGGLLGVTKVIRAKR